MDDNELAKYLGIADDPRAPAVVKSLPPEKRALFERMAQVEIEVNLWSEGLGPKPAGVLIDFDRRR
jgi:hypothetical protein